MSSCPNCFYSLVLLSYRQKYKYAKCSKLFKQKEIDNREFRRWNERQRAWDKENLKLQRKTRITLSPEERQQRGKEARRQWEKSHRDLCRTYSQEYYEKHKDTILAKRKLYRQQTKGQQNIWRKAYRHRQINKTQQLARIHWWRQQQKSLSLQHLENNLYGAYDPILQDQPPTFVPYQLLANLEIFINGF